MALASDIVHHNVAGRKFGPCSEVYSSLFKLINRRFQLKSELNKFNEPSYHNLLSRPSFQHVSALLPHSKHTCCAPIYDSHRLQILRAGRIKHVPAFGIRMNSEGSAITQADRDYMNLALNLALKGQVTPTVPQPFPALDRCTSRTRTRTRTRSQARKRARTSTEN